MNLSPASDDREFFVRDVFPIRLYKAAQTLKCSFAMYELGTGMRLGTRDSPKLYKMNPTCFQIFQPPFPLGSENLKCRKFSQIFGELNFYEY